MKNILIREIAPGDPLPAGFGVAWQSPVSPRVIALPLGLNKAAAALRTFWLWLRYGFASPLNLSPSYHAGYLKGQRDTARRYVRDFGPLVDKVRRYCDAADQLIKATAVGRADAEVIAEHDHAAMRLDSAIERARAQIAAMHQHV